MKAKAKAKLSESHRPRFAGGWAPPAERRDPNSILAAQGVTRIQALLPLRYERMRASPFAFLRGSAAVMAADLRSQADSGVIVQLCGDAHLANFGSFASPEGKPVFDVNDFDETLPGPFEWDIKRLATSLVVSAREGGFGARECAALAQSCARHYRRHMARLAKLAPLAAWQSTVDLTEAVAAIEHAKLRRHLEKRLSAVADASKAHYNLVDTKAGKPRLKPQKTTRDLPGFSDTIAAAFAAYPQTLQPQFADLMSRYHLVDQVFKVVGIGSVGTFCAIGLFVSADGSPLLLQVKEAQVSILAGETTASAGLCEGERVVTGQRRLQAQSDIFLGWTPAPIDGRQFYVRRLKDARLAGIATTIEADMLAFTAELCGRTLARAHGRTGDAAALSRTMMADDKGKAFDAAISRFATDYADQTRQDFDAFCLALDRGTLGAA